MTPQTPHHLQLHISRKGAVPTRITPPDYSFVFSSNVEDWYRSKAHTHRKNYEAHRERQRKSAISRQATPNQ